MNILITLLLAITCAYNVNSTDDYEKYDNSILNDFLSIQPEEDDLYTNDMAEDDDRTYLTYEGYNVLSGDRERKNFADYHQCAAEPKIVSFASIYGREYEFDPPKFVNFTCVEKYPKDTPFRMNNHNHDNAKSFCYSRQKCMTKFKTIHVLKKRNGECWGKHFETIAIGCICHVDVYNHLKRKSLIYYNV